MMNLITLLSNHSCFYFCFSGTRRDCSEETLREMTVGRVLTCTADALVLGSLPVTSPRCLQGQSWDTKRRESRLDLCISMFHLQFASFQKFNVIMGITYLFLAFLLLVHPQCWRESLGSGWRFLTWTNVTIHSSFIWWWMNMSTQSDFLYDPPGFCCYCRVLIKLSFPLIRLLSLTQHITFLVCTLRLCSPGGWLAWRHHLRVFRASWATCPGTGAYT